MIATIALSYILVFWLLDKRRYTELLLFGSLVTVTSLVLSIFGSNFSWFTYNIRILPLTPSPVLYDLTIIPLYYMLVYQYSPDWKRFLLWNAVLSGLIAFGFYPALQAFDIVNFSNNWIPAYFFPIVITFSLISRAVVLGTLRQQNK
ncbi:MAG: hypothetical protein P4L59_19500 [Desulfosporosinus sp.]|nr:hypothetical protein [Desulfosporosinus sp.]